jgi:tetratricopeptide (TPR) repeat protein
MIGAILMLGYVLEQTGDLTGAVERYSAVLVLEPDNTDALRSRANAKFSQRLDREAIVDLERLCELGHEGEGARIRLAVAYLRMGELEAARGHYRKALELNPVPSDAAQVHHHLGIIEMRIGSAGRSVEEYRTALALDPGLVAARLDLGAALVRLGQYEEAAEAYREVVEADPTNSRARRGEAETLEALGRSDEARQRLEEGWQEIPASVELLHALARLLASADDPEVRDGDRAAELAPRTLRAGSTPSRLETLAMASAEAGRFEEAVELQRDVILEMRRQGRVDVLPRLEANLERYRAGQSCCVP